MGSEVVDCEGVTLPIKPILEALEQSERKDGNYTHPGPFQRGSVPLAPWDNPCHQNSFAMITTKRIFMMVIPGNIIA
jgi:hypothetical protein